MPVGELVTVKLGADKGQRLLLPVFHKRVVPVFVFVLLTLKSVISVEIIAIVWHGSISKRVAIAVTVGTSYSFPATVTYIVELGLL